MIRSLYHHGKQRNCQLFIFALTGKPLFVLSLSAFAVIYNRIHGMVLVLLFHVISAFVCDSNYYEFDYIMNL